MRGYIGQKLAEREGEAKSSEMDGARQLASLVPLPGEAAIRFNGFAAGRRRRPCESIWRMLDQGLTKPCKPDEAL